MSDRVLIAYASVSGSTGQIAEAIGLSLIEENLLVDVFHMHDVRVLNHYRAVILGTAIRRGNPLPEALRFVQQHRAALRHIPLAVFSVGVTMRHDTPQSRIEAKAHLAPLLKEINEPFSVGLFAGRLDYNRISLFWRLLTPREGVQRVKAGDWRNWEKIRAWSDEVAARLAEIN